MKTNQKRCQKLWFNKEKLNTVKTPTPDSLLVIGKISDKKTNKNNMDIIENIVMNNNIQLKNLYHNK